MNRAIFLKLIFVVAILGLMGSYLIPLRDLPFDAFIAERPTANATQFNQLLAIAEKRVADSRQTEQPISLYVALRELGRIDLVGLHREYFAEQPFADFVREWAATDATAYEKLAADAQKRVDAGSEDSLEAALQFLLADKPVDLYRKFFADVKLSNLKNIRKSNDALMQVLYNESQSKLSLGLDLEGGTAVTLRIADKANSEYDRENQLDKAVEIMSKRVNGLGVAEPLIRKVPPDGIEIQMPGLSIETNPDAADILTQSAVLKFAEVHRWATPLNTPKKPIGYEAKVHEFEDRDGRIQEEQLYVRNLAVPGSILKEARMQMNEIGAYEVSLEFTSEGAKTFERLTRAIAEQNQGNNIGRLAIILDDKLYSAPSVREAISGGYAQITGNFTQREAAELVSVLNNPLQSKLEVSELYEVGPSLAKDSREASINAAKLGAILVIVFMIAYYLMSGAVAVVSIVLNMVIVLGVLASFGATITLPGVAALVLTIGMAVDGNILIFERIREELAIGKSIKNALQAGYAKAYSTIIDANLTTLITALILIWLGTGPVKGFGVTLAIGIVTSMFAALVISRMFLEMLLVAGLGNFMPLWFKGKWELNFIEKWKPAFLTSWVIVLIGVVTVISKGDKIYGIDFLGGSEITLNFNPEHKPEIAKILEAGESVGLGEMIPVYQRLIGEDTERLKIQTTSENGQAVYEFLKAEFPDAELKKVGENRIGAAVSSEIKHNALYSVAVALLCILLYVALRFEFGYGIGAVVATVHDVLMTIGIFVLFGNQFTAPMLAAILMIVGYSINDTIVVFDRIREELDLNPEMSLFKVINLAISRTLSRTLLTSLTTFLAALALLIFGAGVIQDFAFIFIVGILTGTFSSIFIASPVFYWWHKGDRRHVEEHELTRPSYEWEAQAK